MDSFAAARKIFRQLKTTSIAVVFYFGIVATASSQTVVTQTFTGNGTFNVPTGVTKVTVQAWGGGGAGGGATDNLLTTGGGGAGGTYTFNNNVTVSGPSITVTVGAGGIGVSIANGGTGGTSTFASGTPVTAVGGDGGGVNTGVTDPTVNGPGAPASVGVTFSGGAGGTGTATSSVSGMSGGGGGGAGSGSNGGNASGATGGTGGTGSIAGGNGATGLSASGNGTAATTLSAGGSGGRNGSATQGARTGGNGFRGQVIVTYTLPTAAITYSDADGIFAPSQVVTITATFSEPIQVAPPMQISLSGANILALTDMVRDNATQYHYDYTVGPNDGQVTVALGSGLSVAGNIVDPTPTSGVTFTVDTPPTVVITRAPVTLGSFAGTTDNTVTFNLAFSEPINPGSFTIADIAVNKDVTVNHTALAGGNLVNLGDDQNYTLTITGITGDGNIGITVGPAITDTDVAANPMASAVASLAFTIDNTPLTAPSVPDLIPASDSNINNDDVTNVSSPTFASTADVADNIGASLEIVSSAGGVIGTGTGNGSGGYSIVTTLVTQGLQNITARVTDPAGNTSTSTALAITFDSVVPPTPTVPNLQTGSDSGASTSDNITNDTTPTFDVTGTTGLLLEILEGSNVIAFAASATGASQALTPGVAMAEATYSITARSTDLAGNTASSIALTPSLVIDTTPALVTAIALGSSNPTTAGNVDFDVTFDESVQATTVTTGDFTVAVTGGVAASVNSVTPNSGNSATYTVNVSGITGNGTLGLNKGVTPVTDVAGNSVSTAFTGDIYTVDNTNPTVTINQDPGQADPAFGGSVLFLAVFSEPINSTSFTNSDITFPGASTATGESVTGRVEVAPNDGTTWQITATATGPTPTTAMNVIVATIAASAVTDLAGNNNTASTSTDNSITYTVEPTTPPTSISFSSVTQLGLTVNRTGGNGGNYMVVAKAGSAVDHTVTDGTNYLASLNTNFTSAADLGGGNKVVGIGNGTTFAVTGLLPNTAYHFAMFSLNGNGNASSNFNSTGTINNTTTTACVFPAAPTTLTESHTTTTATLGWTRGTGADFGLVVISLGGTPPATFPTDGISYATGASLNYSTTTATLGADKVVYADESAPSSTSQSIIVTNLSQSTQYSFAIYTFNPGTLCYQTTRLTGTFTTNGPQPEVTLSSAGTVAEPATYAFTTASPGNFVFDFKVVDGADGVDATINTITINRINPGTGNDITDWSGAIAGAQLSDGTNTQTFPTNVAINPNSIVFSSINTGTLGLVASTTTKTYTLTIWLKTTLDIPLPTTIDGKNFVFGVDNSSFVFGGSGSTMAAAQSLSSGNTNDVVDIVATTLVFTQQPAANAIATVPLSTQPILEARDADGNLDLAAIAATVTTPDAALSPNSAPAGFTNGSMNFTTASTFNYQAVGNSRMTVTTTSPALSVTSTQFTDVTANTAVAQLTGGIAPPPNLFSSSTNQALLGFSLTTTGSTFDFTDLTLSANVEPDGKILNIELWKSTTNDYSTGSLSLVATGTTPTASSINFTGITASINSTPSFYFVVADVEANVFATTPDLQLSLTPNTTNVVTRVAGTPTGGITGGAFSGNLYNFVDITPPTILSVTNLVGTIYQGALTQTVRVVFSESMNTGTLPGTITIDGVNWTGPTSLGWSTTTVAGDTYSVTFTHNGVGEVLNPAKSYIASPSGALDLVGLSDTGGGTSADFVIETQRPQATVTVSDNPIFTGDLTQVVTVTFNEPMDAGFNPAITFSPTNNFTAPAGAWSAGNTVWTRTFTHNGTVETTSVVARVVDASGAVDLVGNPNFGDDSPAFIVDTKVPLITDVYSPNSGTFTTGGSIEIQVYFDENVTVTGSPTLSLNSGGTATYVSNPAGFYLVFNYTVAPGENTSVLDVTSVNLAGATIRDARGNDSNLGLGTPFDLPFYTTITIDTQAPSIVSVSSTAGNGYYTAGASLFIQVFFDEIVYVTGAPQIALNSGGTAFYQSGSATSTLLFRYDILAGQNSLDLDYVNTSSLTLPGATIRDVVNINANLTLASPGALNSISDNQDIVIDTQAPQVSSIVIDSNIPPLNGIGSSNGTSQSVLTYTVTFNEPVNFVERTDFNVVALDFAGFPAYPPVSASIPGAGGVTPAGGPATTYVVTVNVGGGTGRLRLDLNPIGIVRDLAFNDNTAGFAGETYSIVLPEPTSNVSGLGAVSISPTQIQAFWSNIFAGQFPTHLLIVATGPAAGTEIVPPAFVPTDGTLPATEEIFSDGNGLAIVNLVTTPGQNFYTFSGMRSGKRYDFEVYPYTLSPNNAAFPDNVNFKTTGTPTTFTTTQTAAAGTLLTGTTSAPTTIGSLSTSFSDVNFSFKIQEDGPVGTQGLDDAKTLISQLVIKANTGSSVSNWSQVVEEAELREITENPGAPILSTAIAASTITFDLSTLTDDNEPGELDDNELKEYELRIRLKNTFTGAAPQNVDGQRFEFTVNTTAVSSFTYVANSSTIAVGQTVNSDPLNGNTNNRVNVIATELNFTTEPPASVMVLKNVVSVSVAPDFSTTPVVRARDIRGNTDRGYNAALAITNTDNIPISQSTIAMLNGVAIFPATFQYQDDGNGTLTITSSTAAENLVIPPPVPSSAVVVNYGTNTTIGISYEVEADVISPLTNSFPGNIVFDFSVNDINVSALDDGAPTRISQIKITKGAGNEITDWSQAIDNAFLYNNDQGTIFYMTAITADDITFTGMPNTNFGEDGYVPSGGTINYLLYAWLKPTLGGTLQDDIDNQHFAFKVDEADILLDSKSSLFNSGETTHSDTDGDNNNQVQVITTALIFTTEPPTPPIDVLINTNLASVPEVEAQDARGNRDVDYSPGGVAVSITNADALNMVNKPTAFVNGVLSFAVPGNFQYTEVGDGTLTVTTSTAAANALVPSPAISNPVNVRVAQSTTITGLATTPPTISSLVTASPGVTVFEFDIEDDGGSEDDGSATQINSISITYGGGDDIANSPNYNWTNAIAGATLSDGTNTVPVTTINSNTLIFNLSSPIGQALGLIANDQTETYTLKIWLISSMIPALSTEIDGLNFEFDVQAANIVTDPTKSAFVSGQFANSGAGNVVDVDATQLDFTTPSGNTSASLNSNFAVVVEARDINRNRDLDFKDAALSTITALTNATNATMTSTPPVVGSYFTLGVFSFPGDFQFISGSNNDNVTLSITAGGISSLPNPPPAPTTPIITLSSSFESVLIVDPAFIPTFDIPYKDFQNISTAGTSMALAQFKLFDGDGTNPDSDGASTNIKDITFSITNPANIRSVGIYLGGALVQAKNNADFITAAGVTSVTFTNLHASLEATDAMPRFIIFTVRASFYNTDANVIDNQVIQLHVEDVTQNGGSQFDNTPPTQIGGIAGGAITDPNVRIEVTATRLDFIIQPFAFAGINQPNPPPPATEIVPQVRARDTNAIVDLDHSFAATISSTASPSPSSLLFSNGILDFTGFQYTSVGDGTMTVTSNGLSSGSGGSIGSNHVDVINVFTTPATGGVITSTNLAGGAQSKVIYGITFNAPYQIGSDPYLNGFTIGFTNSITGIFQNFKVWESLSTTFVPGNATEVTGASIGGKITTTSNSLTVDFTQAGGIPRNLTLSGNPPAPGNKQLSYFLQVDVNEAANSATPSIKPFLIDNGYSNPVTNSNILTSKGSSYSGIDVDGKTYTFAAIFPPSLVSSYPFNGQLNVDPNQPEIELVFSVPVWTLDGVISLYDKATGALVQNLTAVNGVYQINPPPNEDQHGPLAGTAADPLRFGLPPLLEDHVYYITISPGKFTEDPLATDNAGIMDEASNLFPGIAYSGTLFFKTSNPNPPKLMGSPNAPSITNVSFTGATINGTFDQQGTAYFMVLSQGSSIPTNAQIDGSATYPSGAQTGTMVVRGDFPVNQTNPISQFGIFNTTLSASTTYDVWIYAANNSLPNPIPTIAPFGGSSSNYVAGGAGPTMSFITDASYPTIVTIQAPVINVCNNSYQTLNAPIIISEGNTTNFQSSGVQSFNLLLPTGFQFDVSESALGVPIYGKLTLSGSDFVVDSDSLSFINNSILRVMYENTGGSTSDNIIISGLRVKTTSALTGNVVRLGGNALTNEIQDLTPLANLSSFDPLAIDFTNSYSQNTYPASAPVTFVPDNYNAPALTVQLEPLPPVGDFGPSIFSGPGVNINQLSLTAVTLGSPFNITVTHTDNNGCISQNPVQYTVYDHTKAIGGLLIKYGIVNENFPGTATTLAEDTVFVRYNNIVANYMFSMTADIPTTATAGSQIMFGPDWKSLINAMPTQRVEHDPPNNPSDTGLKYYDYRFDGAQLLNANSISNGAIPEPYSNYRSTTPVQGNVFFAGGSLGIIEFTANYQSVANSALQFPLKQNVEFFLPAVPIVELGTANQSSLDTLDALNPVVDPTSSNKGTPVFCVQGGKINISGFPSAAVGTSVGTFTLLDAQTLAPVTLVPNGFVDNGNGTATLDPILVSNSFRDIKIVYTFKENAAPANTQSSGSQIIRITPNPVAMFTHASVIGPNTPVATANCEKIQIDFDATTSMIANGSITGYNWDFSDATNSTGTNPNEVDSTASPSHTFAQSASYNPTLVVTSAVGCKSPAQSANVKIGSIPIVNFGFTGVSTADNIIFKNSSTINSSPSVNDGFDVLDWTYGDGTPLQPITYPTQPEYTSTDVLKNYTSTGTYAVNLAVTSTIGCKNSITHDIIIVDRVIPTDAAPYSEKFESTNGQWLAANYRSSLVASTWAWGSPTSGKSVITLGPDNGSNIWTTNLSGKYNPEEKSALYSPSFDLSQLARPMFSFNSFVQMDQGDGVAIEYSLDNKNIADSTKIWTVLGPLVNGVSTGDHWYNAQGIPAKPGNQVTGDFGWTSIDTLKWQASKHTLDDLQAPAQVVFRFALASIKTNADKEGFAIDNVRIGNRTRTVLVENFKNLGNAATDTDGDIIEKAESDSLKVFQAGTTGTRLIKLNYHVGFPQKDPFNLDNPQDPSARALYYNIKATPLARVDGEKPPGAETLFSTWGDSWYNVQTLKLSEALLEFIPAPVKNLDGTIGISVKVTAVLTDLPANATILHVALAEKSIPAGNLPAAMTALVKTGESDFEYVVKKMLPSATGTRLNQTLLRQIGTAPGQTQTITIAPWGLDPSRIYQQDNLVVIVFLQDEISRKVYQAEVFELGTDPPTITGLEEGFRIGDVSIYPNPADEELNVLLPRRALATVTMQLIDQVGKPVVTSFIAEGERSATLTTRDFAAAVYILKVEENGITTYKRVVITH